MGPGEELDCSWTWWISRTTEKITRKNIASYHIFTSMGTSNGCCWSNGIWNFTILFIKLCVRNNTIIFHHCYKYLKKLHLVQGYSMRSGCSALSYFGRCYNLSDDYTKDRCNNDSIWLWLQVRSWTEMFKIVLYVTSI